MRREGSVKRVTRPRIGASLYTAVSPPAPQGECSAPTGPAPVAPVQSPAPPTRIATPHAMRAAAPGTYTGMHSGREVGKPNASSWHDRDAGYAAGSCARVNAGIGEDAQRKLEHSA